MNILETISNFNLLHQPLVILLRHAEKEPLSKLIDDEQIAITAYGKKQACALGKLLRTASDKKFLIKSSPVQRCIETGAAIIKGLQNDSYITCCKILGAPGAFVVDTKKAAQTFDEYKPQTVVEYLLQDKSLPGMNDKISGTQKLLQEVLKDLVLNNIVIYITHDTILAPFVGTIAKEIFNQNNWFDFLDGACITEENHKYFLYWQQKRVKIDERI